MAKFFVPIIIALIGFWVYFGVFENQINSNQVVANNEADTIIKPFEDFVNMHKSIIKSDEYKNFKEINFGKMSIFIPNYLDTTNELNDQSYFQHENLKKEYYFQIFTATDNDYSSLHSYFIATLDGIRSVVSDFVVIDSTYVKINNYYVFRADLTGNFINGTDILPLKYNVIVAQIDHSFYDITQWTIQKNLVFNEPDMKKVMNSFLYKPDYYEIKDKLNKKSIFDELFN